MTCITHFFIDSQFPVLSIKRKASADPLKNLFLGDPAIELHGAGLATNMYNPAMNGHSLSQMSVQDIGISCFQRPGWCRGW